MAVYKRIVLKISGESLAGEKANGSILDMSILSSYAKVIKHLVNNGVQVSIVVGAGNIWRGKIAENMGMERATGDYMGMLGTIMNALAIQNVLEQNDVKTRVMTSLPITSRTPWGILAPSLVNLAGSLRNSTISSSSCFSSSAPATSAKVTFSLPSPVFTRALPKLLSLGPAPPERIITTQSTIKMMSTIAPGRKFTQKGTVASGSML